MLVKPQIAAEVVAAEVDSITFSVDGPEDIHDKIRGVSGSYTKVCQAISAIESEKKIKQAAKPTISINCTISSVNQGEFSRLIDMAKQYNISCINYAFLFFTDKNAVDKTQALIPVKQVKPENQILPDYLKQIDSQTIQDEIQKCYNKLNGSNLLMNLSPPLTENEINSYFFNNKYSYCNKCFLPWYSSRISPYGDVYPCSIDFKIGNLREKPFSKLWNSENYIHFRNTLKHNGLFPKCLKCCILTTKLWNYLL